MMGMIKPHCWEMNEIGLVSEKTAGKSSRKCELGEIVTACETRVRRP